MKKLFLLSSLFAAAVLTGCSSEEPAVNPDGISDGEARYLSVNIVSANGTSRADSEPGKAGNYEDGSTDENEVTKVRFYFFDAEGAPVNVKASNPGANWWDWNGTPDGDFGPTSPAVADPNVERILNAVVVISTKDGDALPSQMIAVVNPREALGNDSYSLDDIRAITADYATYANKGVVDGITVEESYFPMCNAVYADNGEVVKAAKITVDNYKTTADEAKKPENAVQIYVERNVAKVRVKLDLGSEFEMTEDGLIKLKSYDDATKKASDITLPVLDEDGKTTGTQQVYLKLNGWNVTSDMNFAFLSKRIDTKWTDESLGFKWNHPAWFRSYWASPSENTDGPATSRYGNYNDAEKIPFTGFTYCNENVITEAAKPLTNMRNTKVILNGMLCDENGEALTLCEYYGIKFVDDADQKALKNQVLNYLTDNGHGTIYYKRYTTSDNTAVVEKISAADITFEYVDVPGSDDSYYVRPKLVTALPEGAKLTGWYTSNPILETTKVSTSALNELLNKSQHAKIWKTGMTYYYADINHFGKYSDGKARKGVVRNHVYEMNIKSIYGLGTPVWDPSRTIIPETTTDEDTYVAAQINILSWRIVSNDVHLKW